MFNIIFIEVKTGPNSASPGDTKREGNRNGGGTRQDEAGRGRIPAPKMEAESRSADVNSVRFRHHSALITVFREAESKAESRRNQGRFRLDSPERFRLLGSPRGSVGLPLPVAPPSKKWLKRARPNPMLKFKLNTQPYVKVTCGHPQPPRGSEWVARLHEERTRGVRRIDEAASPVILAAITGRKSGFMLILCN